MAMDSNNDKKVSLEELMSVVLGKMSERRRRFIEQAYVLIDRDHDGFIDSEDLTRAFEGWKHPEVKSGKKKPDDVLHDIIEVLDNCTALHVSLSLPP